MCAPREGLVLDFEIRQGKQTFLDVNPKKLGVRASAVMRLSQCLKIEYHIFMNSYFISLLESLLDKDLCGTGIIMKSRFSFSAHLITEKQIKGGQRVYENIKLYTCYNGD